MNLAQRIGTFWALASLAGAHLSGAQAAAGTQAAASRAVTAANAFLATLSQQQRQAVVFAADDERQRVRWSNFPISIVPRTGISFGEMSQVQRSAALSMLSTVLSARGFEKVQQIMEGDEALKLAEGNRGGPRGNGQQGGRGGLLFGKDLYYFSFLGTPSDKTPWMLQFGGHHLAVNVTLSGANGILTPTLTGAQPALFTLEGKTIRPLGQESDKAALLLNSLTDDQKKQAVLNFRVADLVLGPGRDGKTIQPEGLPASNMTNSQRENLLDVMAEWVNIADEKSAAARMLQLRGEIKDTWFAWSGPTNVTPGTNIASYYRIQGPHVVIEYAPQRMGGNPANHIHTMYRDPTNDYGRPSSAQ